MSMYVAFSLFCLNLLISLCLSTYALGVFFIVGRSMRKPLSKLYLLLLHAHYWQLQDRNVNIFLQHCTRYLIQSLFINDCTIVKVLFTISNVIILMFAYFD
ncbi:hypothetical protein HN51_010835 [Arachis hypogaea]